MANIDHILAKHFSAFEMTTEEQDHLSKWIAENREEYEILKAGLEEVKHDKYLDFDTSKAWDKMGKRIEGKETKVFSIKPVLKYAVAAGIALLLGIGGFNFFKNSTNFIEIANADQTVLPVDLPDGSVVYLASNTTLSYHNDFTNHRDLKLKGEAFFDVARDEAHPFIIETDRGSVQVLGTSFDVKTSYQNTTVSVKSGLVALKNNKQTAIQQLAAGESASCDGTTISNKMHADPNYLSWKTGVFTFEDTPLEDVVDALNTFYLDYNIKLSTESDCRLTGHFDNFKIEKFIEAITLSCNLESSKEDHKFILK